MNIAIHRGSVHGVVARGLVALATIVLAFTSQSSLASAPAPDQSTRQFETRFMQEMIEHHMMAVHMANACLGKAVHQELRAACQEMVTMQQHEISSMRQWLAEWYGIMNHEPSMNPGHHNRMEKLSMLNNSEFEIEFMRQMIRHHKTALVKGSQCVDRAYHEELQDMCAEMVSMQLAEIEQMQEWLCTWYGMCRPRHRQ